MGGRDHSCEQCGRGGMNDPGGKCICERESSDWTPFDATPESIYERVERLEEELVEAEAAVKAKRDEDGP